MRKNTLIGFARIRIAELRLVISGVAIHERGEARWAQLPSRPWVQNGAVVIRHADEQPTEATRRTSRRAN